MAERSHLDTLRDVLKDSGILEEMARKNAKKGNLANALFLCEGLAPAKKRKEVLAIAYKEAAERAIKSAGKRAEEGNTVVVEANLKMAEMYAEIANKYTPGSIKIDAGECARITTVAYDNLPKYAAKAAKKKTYLPEKAGIERQNAPETEKRPNVEIFLDGRELSEKEAIVAGKVVEASKLIHETFLKQDEAGFYPEGFGKEELEAWLKEHPEDERAFTSPYTVVKRKEGRLVAVPYSEEYREFLAPAGKLLREAAELADTESLRRYLLETADAFLSNDYSGAHRALMELDGKIEVAIGPYEVYEDKLFGYKTSFESVVSIKDEKASKELEAFGQHLNEIDECDLADPNLKFTRKSQASPFVVAEEIFAAGRANAYYTPHALNRPVNEEVGSRTILLKNVMKAKFDKVRRPIAEATIRKEDLARFSFDALYKLVAFHERSHGRGAAQIILDDGEKVPVNKMLQELSSPIDEARADMGSLYRAFHLIDTGVLEKESEMDFCTTYLARLIGDLRHGREEPHAKGRLRVYNYLRKKGAASYDENTEKFGANCKEFRSSSMELFSELVNLQASGDYGKAKEFMDSYGQTPAEIEKLLQKLKDVPVDIKPVYRF